MERPPRLPEETCPLCDEVIAHWDTIAPTRIVHEGAERFMHVECSLRSILGGIGHFRDHEYWCTELHDPDGGLSYRESAREVLRLFMAGEIDPDV